MGNGLCARDRACAKRKGACAIRRADRVRRPNRSLRRPAPRSRRGWPPPPPCALLFGGEGLMLDRVGESATALDLTRVGALPVWAVGGRGAVLVVASR